MTVFICRWPQTLFWSLGFSLMLIGVGGGAGLMAQQAPVSATAQIPETSAVTAPPPRAAATDRRVDSATDDQRSLLGDVRAKLVGQYQENRMQSARLAIATGQKVLLAATPSWPGIFLLDREEAEAELAAENELAQFMAEENSALDDLADLEEEQPDKSMAAENIKADELKKAELRKKTHVLQQVRAKYETEIAARRKGLEKTAELEQPWSPSLVTNLALLILGFTLVILCLATFLLRQNDTSGQMTLKVFGIALIISMSALLLIVGYGKDQLTPIIGLFGAIAGYLLGKDASGSAAARPVPKEPGSKTA